ncbi:MAG: beta-lactamase family protein [Acidimicrobiia bacterium]|nr:beta-lactamase family protein [Acidimicrobiia bacterium]
MGRPFHDVIEERVSRPAGMVDTAFLRSDELPGRAAVGYVDDQGLRTNVFHLPVRGNGDGCIYTTAADVHEFWNALMNGRIVSPDTVAEMIRPRSEDPARSMRYGLGLWLDASTDAVSLHGFDPGVGFVSVHDAANQQTYTVLSNKSRGAWPCSQRISSLLADTF